MGVASLTAITRFDVGAASLSSLAAAQLAVYAVMQVPVGILLDRFGPRRLIVMGTLLTGCGNLIVANSLVLEFAVIGRMIVGFGDAFVFVSMIRLINGWVEGGRATRLTQLFANIGQLGQIASAIPFAYILGISGWNVAFTLAASLSLLASLLGFMFLRNDSHFSTNGYSTTWFESLRLNLGDHYTRKAFWVHFTLQSSGSVFILLWGYTFLVNGEELSRPTASAILTSFVFIGFFIGPILSRLCVRFPAKRHVFVVLVYLAITCAWLLILLTPGRNPIWQIIFLVLAIGIGGPASMIAFDYSRTGVVKSRLGSANGLINSGGFVATFSSMALIGLALDVIHSSGVLGSRLLYSLEAFKMAFPVLTLVNTFGLIMFFVERRKSLIQKAV